MLNFLLQNYLLMKNVEGVSRLLCFHLFELAVKHWPSHLIHFWPKTKIPFWRLNNDHQLLFMLDKNVWKFVRNNFGVFGCCNFQDVYCINVFSPYPYQKQDWFKPREGFIIKCPLYLHYTFKNTLLDAKIRKKSGKNVGDDNKKLLLCWLITITS